MLREIPDNDIIRFHQAQTQEICRAVEEELKAGAKRSHWMWFIFPQIQGLGFSSMDAYYSIKSLDEAKRFISDPVLGERYLRWVNLTLRHTDRSAEEIFGYPDVLKYRSSLTLFGEAAEREQKDIIKTALAQFYSGTPDQHTLDILNRKKA